MLEKISQVRPAVVIGLGGTGQWVLTYLKKELMELNGGEMPANVRLLSFDTMPEADATATAAGMPDTEEEVSIGSVKLTYGEEFIGLTGNGFDLGRRIVDGKEPHMGSWFDARHYRDRAQPALWDLATGAGQVRQFGRLGFFMKIDSQIWPRIKKAYEEVQSIVRKDHELEVMIVASFAGGTGAGMFVDMGVVCRALAGLVNNNLMIRGLFVLPRVFGGGGQLGFSANHMKARSFAAWRELDRFVTMGADYGTRRVTYRPGDSNLDIKEIETRPFDVCYLIDSKRSKLSLETTKPEHGVYPSMADFIGTILDPQAGWRYTALVSTNTGATMDQANIPRYSVFGTYSYKVPIHFGLQQLSLSFYKDFIESWLVLRRDENNQIVGLSKMANPEKEGLTGAHEALTFMRAPDVPIRYAEAGQQQGTDLGQVQKIENTLLFPQIAEVFHSQSKNNKEVVLRDAEGGHAVIYQGEVEQGSFLSLMTALPSDVADDDLVRDINTEFTTTVFDAAPLSKDRGGDPRYDADTIQQEVETYMREHFGVAEIGGTSFRGSFGKILDKAQAFQVERFRLLLTQWTRNTLNGYSDDPVMAKRGKLGFALDFYENIVKACDYFVEYLELVRQTRDEQEIRQFLIENLENARLAMFENADRMLPLNVGPHPQAHKSQEGYVAAAEDYATMRRDDLLLESLINTSKDIRGLAAKARDEALKWIQILVTGDAVRDVEGVYAMLEREQRAAAAIFNFDKLTQVTQELLEVGEYDKKPDDVDKELNRVNWKVRSDGGFRLDCIISVPEPKEADEIVTWEDREIMLSGDMTDVAQDKNRLVFMQLGQAQFREVITESRVIELLKNTNRFADPAKLAEYLLESSEPLYMLREGGGNVANYSKALIASVNYQGLGEGVNTYVKGMEDKIKGQNLKVEFVDSGNPHRMTMVHFVEGIENSDFQIWEELQTAYLDHIRSGQQTENAARLHVFPAECNAAEYEALLSSMLDKSHRVFHPRVVTLLENKRNTKLFFRCHALGYIKIEGIEGREYAVIETPKVNIRLTPPQEGKPDIFAIMHAFTNVGRDAVNPQRFLNYEDLLNEILVEEDRLKKDGNFRQRYEEAISAGIVEHLRKTGNEALNKAKTSKDPNTIAKAGIFWHPGQERLDLADLAEMMFREILKGSESDI